MGGNETTGEVRSDRRIRFNCIMGDTIVMVDDDLTWVRRDG